MLKDRIIFFALLLCILPSCARHSSAGTASDTVSGKKIEIKYSSLLRLYENDGYIRAVVLNPADTSKIARTYILHHGISAANLPDGTAIKVPIEKSIICTSLHAGLLKTLGALGQIAGTCDSKYIVDSVLRSRIDDGRIVDCGYTAAPDREKVLQLMPDAVLLSPYDGMQTTGFYDAAGIPVVDCVDYLERSPLGQAEWIKFYGILTGRERVADSIFNVVETGYKNLRDSIMFLSYRPTLLTEKMYQQTWFVPTGRSTSGEFYRDAGFIYLFDGEYADGRVSVPLTFEQVFTKAHDADYWIFKYYGENRNLTLDLLAAENPNYKDFGAFKSGHVYACNTWEKPFYDQTPFRPDILLRELVNIAHPGFIDDYKPQYFFPLQ